MKEKSYKEFTTELYNYLQNKQKAAPETGYDALVYYAKAYADMYKEEMAKFVKENNITDENLGLARFYYADMEKYEGKRFTERLNAALIKKLESLKTMEELEEAEKFEIIKSANNNYFITNRQDAEKIVDSEIKVKPKNSKDELDS